MNGKNINGAFENKIFYLELVFFYPFGEGEKKKKKEQDGEDQSLLGSGLGVNRFAESSDEEDIAIRPCP